MPEMPKDNFSPEEEPLDVDAASDDDAGLRFLKEKYDLHNAPETEAAKERTEMRTAEHVPQDPEFRIQNYLNRFNKILNREDPDKRERGIEAIKHVLHDKFVITPEKIPEGYFENQQRIAREYGHGDIEITEETRQQLAEVIVADQQSTLDNWIDYLSSPDATYPDWLKYYAVRSILGMGEFDKEKKQFTKRSAGTTKPFPDLNREALAYVLDAIEKKCMGEGISAEMLEGGDKEKFEKLLQGENFAKLYAFAIEEVTPASVEQITITEGKWVKYERGSDHMRLVESLQGHGTGWCTAGESTAEAQLGRGDFYVYYSLDQNGNPTIPRAAIRMQENGIAEVRGIGKEQNLDPYIGDAVQGKLHEFPDGKAYEKKAQDMKLLTAVENKVEKGQNLVKDDLVFLYEIDAPIEGFGYQRDPRIAQLREQRNPEHDMPIVFECAPEQIAHTMDDINENTKAYVGKLEEDIFQKLPENLEHIYTSFPEGKIRTYHIETQGETQYQYQAQLREKNITVVDYAKDLLESPDFAPSSENIDLVRVTVKDLGFPQGATIAEIYSRREALGLELCPPAVGPALRLVDTGGDWMAIGMKQIAGRGGRPFVFSLNRESGELRLYVHNVANLSHRWDAVSEFVFRLRKKLESSES